MMSYCPTLASSCAVPSSALMDENCKDRLAGFTLASACLAVQVPTATSGNVHLIVLAAASFPFKAVCAPAEGGSNSKKQAIITPAKTLLIDILTPFISVGPTPRLRSATTVHPSVLTV